jgi:hypothetical protein
MRGRRHILINEIFQKKEKSDCFAALAMTGKMHCVVIARSGIDEAISAKCKRKHSEKVLWAWQSPPLTYKIASPSTILPHQKVETFLELSVSKLERRQ